MKLNSFRTWLVILVTCFSPLTHGADLLSTAFTYQGRLNEGGAPANGIYDLRFALYDATGGDSIVAGPVTNAAIVANGLFTVTLDFGAVFDGHARWLEIAVRPSGGAAFTTLVPRQPLTPAPQALFALTSGTATNLGGTLPATQLTGTLPEARLSTNVAWLNTHQVFTASNTFAGVVRATNGNNTLAGTFTGSGAGLTNLNAGALSSGTLPLAQLPGAVLTNNASSVTLAGGFSGNGTGLTNLNASQLSSGRVADARLSPNVALLNTNQVFSGFNLFTNAANDFTGFFTGNFTGRYAGNGAGITNLDANSLASGGISEARLSVNVALLNRAQIFTGFNLFTNSANAFTGGFTGNGAGLTNLDASDLASGILPEARLSNNVALLNRSQTYSGANQFTNPANAFAGAFAGTFTGNAAGLTNLDAGDLANGILSDVRLSTNVALLTNGLLADARLAPNVALLNKSQTFTGSNTFTHPGNAFTGSFSGDGGGLTNVQGAQLAPGTVAAAQLGTGAAAANLAVSGQSAVGSGGIIFSELSYSADLVNAGYVKIGRVQLIEEGWTTNAPGPARLAKANAMRVGHTAVWTGSEMIVWGGSDENLSSAYPNALNPGLRYDPATDAWAFISTNGAPSPRSGHVAVWTGSRMIVWGGPANTGGRYNPVTDTWTGMSTTNAPEARFECAAAWVGNVMTVWGGFPTNMSSGFSSRFADGARYNPSTDTWSAMTTNSAPSERSGMAFVSTGTELIIWGGYGVTNGSSGFILNALPNGGRYNPSTDHWIALNWTGAEAQRASATAVWTGTQMLVWGGFKRGYPPDYSEYLMATGFRYTPAQNTWSAISTNGAPMARRNYSIVWGGGRMVIWGGTGMITGGCYNPTNDTWSDTSEVNVPQIQYPGPAVWDGAEMLVWGSSDSSMTTDVGAKYNVTNNTWTGMNSTRGACAPGARAQATAIWTGSEMIVWGGESDAGYLNTGGRYNPAANTWTSLPTEGAPTGRLGHTAVWSGLAMLVWGGDDSTVTATGGRYFPLFNTWLPMNSTNAPAARRDHTSVWTGTEMLVWGGCDPRGALPTYHSTGARYDPIADSWTALGTNNAPLGRSGHTAVFTGEEMIVWGGERITASGNPPTKTYYNNGSRYHPGTDTWTALPSNNAPSARSGHSAVWTSHEMYIWGGTAGTDRYTGACFNPKVNTWYSMSTLNAPAARHDHVAVWDGSHLLVWGGQNSSGALRSGGWYAPGAGTWTPITLNNAPPTRTGNTVVWTGTEMIIWSGYDGVDYLDTTYSYTPPRTPYLYLRP